ncbi:MAG: VRR-NUC domain-containing protein [Bellilinea sp.]
MSAIKSPYARGRISEHSIQAAFVQQCRWNEQKYPPLKLLFAIPNGGARNAVTGAMLKKEGVLKGILDLFLPWPSGGYHGLFIEIKTPSGRLSLEQKAMMSDLESAGYRCVEARSAEAAWLVVMDYLGVKRG